MSKYNKSVSLHCPVCGHTQFEVDEDNENTKCADCGNELNKDELIRENNENIQSNVDAVKDEIIKDLKKIFKGKFK
ncbi:TFIIB-type zinc ribbon-containing protein [Pectobacterium parmentieri]|uniref:TFIIB-type zinc ribbon-containing protein n=2 Tax=Pectobacterium TaxID=122277 RepID=A0A0H3I8Z3_PECPM|nr:MULTISPECIES: TFIIB-type zinc ribbon-containing protein [Pectobacterium]AFI90421.1 Hypothetical protein W5S_2333 [Pectobacterium parmentieri]MBI0473394.1 TFIIB-type zinc ribbon-containing protein [Pectobacterium parmentieri]MBI0496024.1 TFIIB-type zinc ribbon-containing protein [Pectobacterium parmentieri]MBI0557426.1 TFIIB-type zinc ribbon-containing protein [Pectobacterium parmentieri]MBI0570565.1 TFIIB-type zinc ribbon-containing protein [Pectobacterium parmentieri]